MINIFNKLSLFISNRNNKKNNNNRHDENYDESKFNKQKLYEKWCKKEKWLLYNEGILLLLSIDPSKNNILDEEITERVINLKDHARECVKKNLLSVIDSKKTENDWEVKPIDLFRWATISRIDIPAEFSTLMIFISQTIKEDPVEETHNTDNEIILGATISLLANSVDICRDKDGNIDSKIIVSKIIENKENWFGNRKSYMSEDRMINLIQRFTAITKDIN